MRKVAEKRVAYPTGKDVSETMQVALETARDLMELGVISERTMRGYEARCRGDDLQVEPQSTSLDEGAEGGVANAGSRPRSEKKARPATQRLTAQDVVRIRAKERASQGYFAMQLQVSASTVQQWESGAKRPSPMASRLLEIVDRHGLGILGDAA